MIKWIVHEFYLPTGKAIDAVFQDDAIDGGAGAAASAHQRLERKPASQAAQDAAALGASDLLGGQRKNSLVWPLLVVFADRVKNRGRRAVEPAGDSPGNFLLAAVAGASQASSPADDLISLGVTDRRKIGSDGDLLAVSGEEPLDAGQEKTDPTLTVGEKKSPRRQSFATPALNGLTCDVESLAHIIDGKDRIGRRLGRNSSVSLTFSIRSPRSC